MLERPLQAGPRLHAIDMVRALAALAVVVSHVAEQNFAWSDTNLAFRLAYWLGTWGVGLFFVLSGFCIHLPHARRLAADPDAPVKWGRFFGRRARRILPPHYAALVLSLVVGLYVKTLIITAPTTFVLLMHVLMLHPFFGPDVYYGINSVFWSIGVEVHFYLLYPVYLFLRRRLGSAAVAPALFFVGLAIYGFGSLRLHGDARFIAQHIFAVTWWQWGLGAWLADVYAADRLAALPGTGRGWAWAWAAASLGLAWIDVTIFGLHLRMWALPIVCAFGMAALIRTPGLVRSPWLDALGEASYSIYLTHPVAIALVVLGAGRLGFANGWALAVLEGALSLPVALLFFQAVERHFLNTRRLAPVQARVAAMPSKNSM